MPYYVVWDCYDEVEFDISQRTYIHIDPSDVIHSGYYDTLDELYEKVPVKYHKDLPKKQIKSGKTFTCLTDTAENIVIKHIDQMIADLEQLEDVEYIDFGDGEYETVMFNSDTSFREKFGDQLYDYIFK